MNYTEKALVFPCCGHSLVGVLTLPQSPLPRGVVIVVGGPQYRVGSHRQFLVLSRQLADANIAVFRFDYRGMGDSEGETRTFEGVDEDIRSAIDAFFSEIPSLNSVVIWALCDAASAALIYAPGDPRISGLVLANPWVRTPEGMARVMIKHYYLSRLLQRVFWQKLLAGQVKPLVALRDFLRNILVRNTKSESFPDLPPAFPDRMAVGLQRFPGPVLWILSGEDLTAQEFEGMIRTAPIWRRAIERQGMAWRRLPEATHTFSRQPWREQIGRWTIDWMKSL